MGGQGNPAEVRHQTSPLIVNGPKINSLTFNPERVGQVQRKKRKKRVMPAVQESRPKRNALPTEPPPGGWLLYGAAGEGTSTEDLNVQPCGLFPGSTKAHPHRTNTTYPGAGSPMSRKRPPAIGAGQGLVDPPRFQRCCSLPGGKFNSGGVYSFQELPLRFWILAKVRGIMEADVSTAKMETKRATKTTWSAREFFSRHALAVAGR